MNLQKAIDPIGVAERRARKLKRRRYITPVKIKFETIIILTYFLVCNKEIRL